MTDKWDEVAREIAAQLIAHTTSVHNVNVIAEALRIAARQENEACAKVAKDFADRMTETMQQALDANRPSLVADCKADAGFLIERRIRSRMKDSQ